MPKSTDYRDLWMLATTGGTPATSLRVAVVVGTIINCINQADALVTGQPLIYWKLALTYCVPYCVATYGAVMAKLKMRAAPPS